MVEHQLPKLKAAGSIPVSRSGQCRFVNGECRVRIRAGEPTHIAPSRHSKLDIRTSKLEIPNSLPDPSEPETGIGERLLIPATETLVLLRSQMGVCRHEVKGRVACLLEDLGVLRYIGDLEVGHSALTRAKEITGAPNPKIRLADFEPVVRSHHRLQALLGLIAPLIARQKDAVTLGVAPTHAPTQLV